MAWLPHPGAKLKIGRVRPDLCNSNSKPASQMRMIRFDLNAAVFKHLSPENPTFRTDAEKLLDFTQPRPDSFAGVCLTRDPLKSKIQQGE